MARVSPPAIAAIRASSAVAPTKSNPAADLSAVDPLGCMVASSARLHGTGGSDSLTRCCFTSSTWRGKNGFADSRIVSCALQRRNNRRRLTLRLTAYDRAGGGAVQNTEG